MRGIASFVALALAVVCLLGAVAALFITPTDSFAVGRSFKFMPELARAFGEPVARGILFALLTGLGVLLFRTWHRSHTKARNAS